MAPPPPPGLQHPVVEEAAKAKQAGMAGVLPAMCSDFHPWQDKMTDKVSATEVGGPVKMSLAAAIDAMQANPVDDKMAALCSSPPLRPPASPTKTLNLTPKRTPGSARGNRTPMRSPLLLSPTPTYTIKEVEGENTDCMTLRKADGDVLGLSVDFTTGHYLAITAITGGAIEAWNRSCMESLETSWRALRAGDKIIEVNGRTNPQEMLDQCRNAQLLKLVVVHVGDIEEPAPSEQFLTLPTFPVAGAGVDDSEGFAHPAA
jgi:hypothetical protein